tara:strand:- start:1806 stop:2252 length:447 start_codon:yes stop_codon:yes gene_type:complete
MRRPYAWAKVERGDIISFRYKTKQGGTSTKRLFLVLEPKLINKAKNPTTKHLMHGYQLEDRNFPLVRGNALIELFRKVGIPVLIEEGVEKLIIEGRSQQVYSRTRQIIQRYGIYRTFDYTKVRANQVFQEPVKVSASIMNRLEKDMKS